MSQTYVFIHGWGLNQAIWEPTMAKLPVGSQSISLNIPGFGGAPWRADFTDITACADHMAQTIMAQSHQPVVLVGWSLGGLLATHIALRHPELVVRLHTVASSPCFMADPETNWPGIQAAVLTQFQQQLETNLKATLKRFLAVQAMGSTTARDDIQALQQLVLAQPAAKPEALKTGLDWLAKVDLRGSLEHLKMPLCRAYGRLDSLVPVSVATRIQHGSASIFRHSAHTPFMNQPEAFMQWLVEPSEHSFEAESV